MDEEAGIVPGDHPSSYVLRMSGMDQSHVDLGDPTRIAFDYVRRMADVVDSCAPSGRPLRVVHVGGGALTLPRYVATVRPRSPQVVLEPAAGVTDLVRRELPLPRNSGIKVRPVDGRTGLAALRDGWSEVVVLDAYDDARVPADLVSLECLVDVARVLDGHGLLLLNLSDRAPFAWTRRVVAGLRATFAEVMLSAEPATLRGRRPGNLLLVGGVATVPLAALRSRAATSPAPYRVLDSRQVSDGFGGGSPFTDADSEASPPP